MAPVLDLHEIWTAYGKSVVHRGVSVKVDPGEVVVVLGANGAGKSTLLRAIAGLMQPMRGKVMFNGRDVTALSADQRSRAGIVLVPEGRRIFGHLTVLDNLMLGAYSRRDRDVVENDRNEMLSMFPILESKLNQRGGELSGGQQQMLAIARGLMGRPTMLLLDEPSLGLAPLVVEQLVPTIERISVEFGTGVLLVEQNAGLAMAVADRGYLMDVGNIVAEGDIDELAASDLVRETFLGPEWSSESST